MRTVKQAASSKCWENGPAGCRRRRETTSSKRRQSPRPSRRQRAPSRAENAMEAMSSPHSATHQGAQNSRTSTKPSASSSSGIPCSTSRSSKASASSVPELTSCAWCTYSSCFGKHQFSPACCCLIGASDARSSTYLSRWIGAESGWLSGGSSAARSLITRAVRSPTSWRMRSVARVAAG